MRVIPSFNKLEDRDECFDLGFVAKAVEQFAFESGKETLSHGIVEAIADGAH